VFHKFTDFAWRSLINLKKHCSEVLDKFKNLAGGPKFKNFAGRSLIKLKFLQRGP